MGRYQTENSENRILEAAEKEFLRKGFAGARTIEIAKEAGVTHAMLHYYFRTKEELFKKILEQKIFDISNSFDRLFEETNGDFEIKLEQCIRSHFEFIKANPMLPEFVLREARENANLSTFFQEMILPRLFYNLQRFQSELDTAAEQGVICPIAAPILMYDIVALNIFSIMSKSIITSAGISSFISIDDFYEKRLQENITLIKSRLQIK